MNTKIKLKEQIKQLILEEPSVTIPEHSGLYEVLDKLEQMARKIF